MNKLRNLFTAAVAALTLSAAVLETTPSDARGHFGGGHHFGHFHRRGFHGHRHWGFHGHRHWGFHGHYHGYGHYRYHWHRWGYHFGGYRSVTVEGGAVCPIGTHLGYLGKHCWPNR